MPQSLKSNYPVKRQYSKERVKDEKNEEKKKKCWIRKKIERGFLINYKKWNVIGFRYICCIFFCFSVSTMINEQILLVIYCPKDGKL